MKKSFRPISLSNYLLKGLEKLLVEQMDLALEDHPIHKNLHGLQRGLSTETAISKTVNYIEKHETLDEKSSWISRQPLTQYAQNTVYSNMEQMKF